MNDVLKYSLAIAVPGLVSGLVFVGCVWRSGRIPPAAPPPPKPVPIAIRDIAAEEAFQKIEDLYLSSATLKFAFRDEFCGEGPPQSSLGSCLFKEGGKVRFNRHTLETHRPAEDDLTVVSDGRQLFSSAHPESPFELPRDLDRTIRLLLVRSGPGAGARLDPLLFPEVVRERFLDQVRTSVDHIAFGPENRGLKNLKYRLHFSDPMAGFQMELWYDPVTDHVARYFDHGSLDGSESASREAVLECTLDVDIPDDTFTLPRQDD
jgi:hypothetical protein